jgi:plasmid stabilization system protein ParE
MSRLLVLEPEAEAEIFNTAGWYEQRNPAACAAFLRAIDRALRLIQDHPEQYQVVYREARRALWMDFRTRFSINSPTAKSSSCRVFTHRGIQELGAAGCDDVP